MGDNVSFSSLFRRGKYARPDVQESDKEENKRNRFEEFSVAAVAFAMKHDDGFKRYFLERICEVTIPFNPDAYEIFLQPHDFDMVLRSEMKSEYIVIEFKVWAKLAPHQNYYENEQTFTGKDTNGKDGYGRQILNYGKGHSTLKYIVLAQNRDKLPSKIISCDGIFIKCHFCAWQELSETTTRQGKIANDLLDSLASDIPELKIRQFFNMKKSKFVVDATESYNLLREVWKPATGSKSDPDFYIGRNENDCWFGVNLNEKGVEFVGLPKHGSGDSLGWYGYEKTLEDRNRLSVWIYCRNEQEAIKTSPIIENYLGQKPERQDKDLIIVCDEQKSVGDAEWLLSKIQKLREIPPIE
jgi:hypothetical protein